MISVNQPNTTCWWCFFLDHNDSVIKKLSCFQNVKKTKTREKTQQYLFKNCLNEVSY